MVGNDKKELRKKARNLRNKMTKAEILLWTTLKSRQICGYKFRRQQPVLDYIADFYCHPLKLIIEVDGEIHSLPEVSKTDAIRNRILNNNGYKIIHLLNHEIETDLKHSVSKIESFITNKLSPSHKDHRRTSR